MCIRHFDFSLNDVTRKHSFGPVFDLYFGLQILASQSEREAGAQNPPGNFLFLQTAEVCAFLTAVYYSAGERVLFCVY